MPNSGKIIFTPDSETAGVKIIFREDSDRDLPRCSQTLIDSKQCTALMHLLLTVKNILNFISLKKKSTTIYNLPEIPPNTMDIE